MGIHEHGLTPYQTEVTKYGAMVFCLMVAKADLPLTLLGRRAMRENSSRSSIIGALATSFGEVSPGV